MTIALIDSDILLYRVGFTTEDEELAIALYRMDDLINRILSTLGATEYRMFLSGGRTETFRAKLNPQYKANRVQPKPKWYNELKEHLINTYHAEVQVDQEADDALGIAQYSLGIWKQYEDGSLTPTSYICSIDKDLHQIPGGHYNFVKDEIKEVTPEEGKHWFYCQLLMGDKVDNIKGIDGIGPKKAEKYLQDCFGDSDYVYFDKVLKLYREHFGDLEEQEVLDMILLNGQMLKIRTEEGEIWRLPNGPQEDENLL